MVAHTVRADLGEPLAIAAMFARITAAEPRLDVLVANAAATAFKPLLEAKAHNLAQTFAITVAGFLDLAQRAAALMPPGSSIVAVSGFDAIRVIERHGILGPAKAALESLVRYLAVELAPRGIRVNGVSPGYIDTDSARFYAGDDFESRDRLAWTAQTPLGRPGHARRSRRRDCLPGLVGRFVRPRSDRDRRWRIDLALRGSAAGYSHAATRPRVARISFSTQRRSP